MTGAAAANDVDEERGHRETVADAGAVLPQSGGVRLRGPISLLAQRLERDGGARLWALKPLDRVGTVAASRREPIRAEDERTSPGERWCPGRHPRGQMDFRLRGVVD